MTQEPQHDNRKQALGNDHNGSDEEVADLQIELECNGVYDQIYRMAEKLATTQLGQIVLDRCDRVLRSIEDTAKWSLPQESFEDKLVRPFNWVFFLTLIVALRFVRIGLSICAFMIGNSPVSAQDMVYFIQTRRRKLRAIRLHGIKEIQRRKTDEDIAQCDVKSSGFTGKISALLSIAICRPGQHSEPVRRVFIRRDQMKECISQEDSQACKRRRNDDNSDPNLTFDQMLSKYADENSGDDPDYEPNLEDESSDGSTSSGSENSDTEDQEDIGNLDMHTDKETVANIVNAINIPSQAVGNKKSQLNQSVEIKENGNGSHYRLIPKPMMAIKHEPLSDIDSGTEQQQSPNLSIRNVNHDNKLQKSKESKIIEENTTLSTNSNKKLNIQHENIHKSTPGHESAAMMKSTSDTVITAGSPTELNACFIPVSILKHPTVPTIKVIGAGDVSAHSTPKSAEEILESPPTDASSTTSSPKKHVHHQQPHRNRNRGKNRR